MRLALEGQVRVPDAVLGQVGGDALRLGRRDDRVVQPLQQQDRAGRFGHVPDWRPLLVGDLEAGQRPDQAIQVVRFEVVGAGGEAAQVGDAGVGHCRAEHPSRAW